MSRLAVPPTKSSLLALRRQLAFAREGYDLLEQKRKLLVFELMRRLRRALDVERRVEAALSLAFAELREALLDSGAAEIDRAAFGVRMAHTVDLSDQRLMGMRLPVVRARIEAAGARFGMSGTTARTDAAARGFAGLLPALAELAELQTVIHRLARELRGTQRRCNALERIFIPDYRDTIAYIEGELEEREREAFVIFRMIRERLARGAGREARA
jgi:V/A-type H+-transporting ATPase subunit D